MSALRLRLHALREALRVLRRRPATIVLCVVACTIAIGLPLLAASLAVTLQAAAGNLNLGPEISVFTSMAATNDEVKALQARLRSEPGVISVRWLSRDEALADLGRRGSAVPSSELKVNPLPDTLIVSFALTTASDSIEASAAAFRKLPRVDSVQFDISWHRKATAVGRAAAAVLAIAAGATALLIVLVILGAVRLIATASPDELQLHRLIGTDERQIRRPYVYAGTLTVISASALAIALTWATLQWLAPGAAALGRAYGLDFELVLPPWPALAGAAVAAAALGALSASTALRRLLRRIT
jgi:cell division transport system permease protein